MGQHLTLFKKQSQEFISSKSVGIPSNDSDSLCASMRRRQPIKDILSRRMKEAGVSPPDMVRRALERGGEIGKTSINDMLNGTTRNPGIFTVGAAALGMNLPPSLLAAEILGDLTDDPNFKGSQLAIAYEIYRSMTPTQRKMADPHIEALLFLFQRIKDQK